MPERVAGKRKQRSKRMGGGKGGTTTSTVSIPPEVLARYNAVNARAEDAAKGSFQPYTGQFVAGLTPTQEAGIKGTNAAAGLAQPFYQAGANLTAQGSQAVGPLTKGQIGYYQDPYVQSVVDPTRAALQQEQGQQRTQQQAQAIKSGAFGGDRSGLERANLARQQTLGMSQAINPLYSQAYQSGVQTAMGQQGVISSDLQRKLAAGQQMAGLGTGAQGAALQGAQQQLAAGTAEQQTKQADLTAQYQQFLQKQGFPYQQAQFLANIAMGTGALSGSTTTTQQPTGFFSDRRLKHDVKEIGETHDGQPIYSYKYNGDNKTQIGLMAQDVEKHHPEAVGVMGGYKTVDYGKATEDSERPERAAGGVIPNSMGGGVWHPDAYAGGGLVDGEDMKAILQAQQAGFGPWGGGGVYGGAGAGSPGGKSPGIVPQASLPVPKLVTAGSPPARQASGLSQAASTGQNIASVGRAGVDFKNWVQGLGKDKPGATPTAGKDVNPADTGKATPVAGAKPNPSAYKGPTIDGAPKSDASGNVTIGGAPVTKQSFDADSNAGSGVSPAVLQGDDTINLTNDVSDWFAHGGVVPRYHRAGGGVNPYKITDDMSYIPESVLEEGEKEADQASGQFKKNTGQGGGGSGSGSSTLGDVAKLAGTAKTLFDVGTAAAAMFSDERMKDNIRPVGKTFDGQNIYSYDMGDGRTKMGLLAQEVLRHKPEAVGESHGYLTVDYNKATEDAAPHKAMGGVVPRHGYALDGAVDPTSDQPEYDPRADMPSERAVEAAYKPDEGDVYSRLHPEFGPRLRETIRLANEAGIPVKPGSTIRSIEEQAALRGAKDRNERGAYQSLPVALPGHSAHNYAIAGDIVGLKPEHYGKFGEIARGQGLTYGGDWKGGNYDPIHVQYGVGGFGQLKDAPRDEKGHVILPEGWATGKGIVPPREVPDISNKVADASGSIGRASTLGDVFKSVTPDSIPSNENFWIPALAGVGSMLASSRPTLLGAVGEGLVGGVSGYQAQQKQEMERAKQFIDFARENFVQTYDPASKQTVQLNKMTGQMYAGNDFQKYMYDSMKKAGISKPEVYGIMPPSGPSAPGERQSTSDKAQTVADVASSPKVTSPNTTPAANSDKPSENIYTANPGQLREMVISGKIPGGPADAAEIQSRIKKTMETANEMADNPNPDIKAKGIQMRQLAATEQEMLDKKINAVIEYQSKQNDKFAEGRAARIGDYQKDVQARAATYSQAIPNLTRMADIAIEQPTGRGAEAAADAVSILKRVGMDRFIPENWKDYLGTPGGYDQIMKISTAQMLNQLMADKIIRAPASGAKYEAATVPSPTTDPDAFYALIGTKLGETLHSQAKDNAWVKLPTGAVEPANHELTWPNQKGNRLDDYKRQAFSSIPANKRVSEDAIRSLQHSTRDAETGETFKPRMPEGSAPATAPVVIRNDAEYNALKPGTTYTAPDGSIRRKQ